MRFSRTDSYEPTRARPQQPPRPRTKRRYGGLVVLVLYVAALGLNEWRLHRHVAEVRARQAQVVDAVPTETGDAPVVGDTGDSSSSGGGLVAASAMAGSR